MATSDELKLKRKQYISCLKNVQNTANNLSNSINSLQSLVKMQGSCYVVDDVNGGTNFLNYLLEKENGIYLNIVNNIIPGTQAKIDELEWKIIDAVAKEELEKEGI